MSLEEILLLLIALLLVALIFYMSGAVVGRDWSVTGGYVLRLLLVAVIAVVVIPVFRDAAAEFDFGDIGLLFAFVILILAVRFLLVEELPTADDWLTSIVVSFLGVLLIYAVDKLADMFFDIKLLSLF